MYLPDGSPSKGGKPFLDLKLGIETAVNEILHNRCSEAVERVPLLKMIPIVSI